MTNKLVAFRIEEKLWERFQGLVEESERSVQDVLRTIVATCVELNSIVINPVAEGKTGRERADELRLRDLIQQLRGCMEQMDYDRAQWRFNDLTNQMEDVRSPTLLDEAQLVAARYLQWVGKRHVNTIGDRESGLG